MARTATFGVGSLTAGTTAEVDPNGTVRWGTLRLDWCVHTGRAWIAPGRDLPARRSRPHAAPIVQTALRVRGGDVVERVYAVGDAGRAAVVVEVENDSPEAVAAGFVVDARGDVVVSDDGVRVGGAPAVAFGRRPGAIEDGNRIVFPVPHRTTVRVALTAAPGVDVRGLAGAAAVERAWDAVLDRGLRTELPEPLQSEVDAARADLLLAPPSAETFVALEAWGFDAEAIAMWGHLRTRARRSARRASCGGVLGEVRDALVREHGRTVDLLPGFRGGWLGQPLAAHDVPLRRGPCSFAVRWHEARPALLWEAPEGTTVRAPALDAAWSSSEPRGEALLAAPPATLLSMGEGVPARGAPGGPGFDPPEQFS